MYDVQYMYIYIMTSQCTRIAYEEVIHVYIVLGMELPQTFPVEMAGLERDSHKLSRGNGTKGCPISKPDNYKDIII